MLLWNEDPETTAEVATATAGPSERGPVGGRVLRLTLSTATSGGLVLLAAVILASCVGGPNTAHMIAFVDVASASTSRHEGGPALIVGTSDSARATIASLRPGLTLPDGVVLVAVFEGQQPTGGFAIRVTGIARNGGRLIVRAVFGKPLDNSIDTAAPTSPTHIVSIASSEITGVRDAVLVDETGAERAHANLT